MTKVINILDIASQTANELGVDREVFKQKFQDTLNAYKCDPNNPQTILFWNGQGDFVIEKPAPHRRMYTMAFLQKFQNLPSCMKIPEGLSAEAAAGLKNDGKISPRVDDAGFAKPSGIPNKKKANLSSTSSSNDGVRRNFPRSNSPSMQPTTSTEGGKSERSERSSAEIKRMDISSSSSSVSSLSSSSSAITQYSPHASPTSFNRCSIWGPGRKVGKQENELDKKLNGIRADINKMTKDTEKKISERVMESLTEECLNQLVPFIFEKGVHDSNMWGEIYIRLCVNIHNKHEPFKRLLIGQCQKEFEKSIDENLEDDERIRAVKKRLNLIKFVVELFKVELLTNKIILLCIGQLIKGDVTQLNENDATHGAELLLLTIPLIMSQDVLKNFKPSIAILRSYKESKKTPTRATIKIDELMVVVTKKKLI